MLTQVAHDLIVFDANLEGLSHTLPGDGANESIGKHHITPHKEAQDGQLDGGGSVGDDLKSRATMSCCFRFTSALYCCFQIARTVITKQSS